MILQPDRRCAQSFLRKLLVGELIVAVGCFIIQSRVLSAGYQRDLGMQTIGPNRTEVVDAAFRTQFLPLAGATAMPTLVLAILTLARKRLVPRISQQALR